MYLIALLPLLMFGCYKNGVEVYMKGFVGLYGLAKPLLLLSCSVLGAMIGGILREWKNVKKFNFSLLDKIKGDVVEAVLVVAILPIDSNPLTILGITMAFGLFLGKVKINKVALLYIVIEGLNVLWGLNNFKNAYEINTVLNYNGLDLFFGSGTGGIFSTNVFLILLGYLFLSYNKLYKKEMVLASVATFLLLGSIPKMIGGQYTEILPYIFGYNVLFVLVFVAPNLYSSSYTLKGQIVSGILIGILCFAISFMTSYTAAVLAVLIASGLKGILDRMFVIK